MSVSQLPPPNAFWGGVRPGETAQGVTPQTLLGTVRSPGPSDAIWNTRQAPPQPIDFGGFFQLEDRGLRLLPAVTQKVRQGAVISDPAKLESLEALAQALGAHFAQVPTRTIAGGVYLDSASQTLYFRGGDYSYPRTTGWFELGPKSDFDAVLAG